MCGSAQAVESQIVGYTTKACEAGKWYMVGCGFNNVGGTALDIQNFITGLTARKSAESPAFIQVWNGATLDTYNYTIYFDKTLKQNVNGWVKAGEGGKAAELEIPAGFTCWFIDPVADVNITVAGEVVPASTAPITVAANEWKMVANPYPVATTLNGGLIDWSNFTARKSAESPDFIQFWNGTALDTYNYTIYFDKTLKQNVNGWVKAGEGGKAAELDIPVGTGFWMMSYTGGDIIFNKESPVAN